jgi:choline-sulfatase
MTRKPRNLLFLFSDQHAARVAGCYGDPVAETPALDALAARGTTFDAAICPSPMCVPSRMSMLTARNPHRIGVWGNEDVMHPGLPTMAHALGAAGLDPVLVGRLHAVGPDQMLGYARREVGDHHANWSGVPRVDMGPLEGSASPDRRSLTASGRGQSAYEVKDEDVTARALEVLDELAADLRAGRRERFALTVGYMLPHAPFVARAAYFDRFAGRVGLARNRRPDAAQATVPRPLAWLADLVALTAVWLAGPAVIAGFWWRSMPAHDEGMTLAIAGALGIDARAVAELLPLIEGAMVRKIAQAREAEHG